MKPPPMYKRIRRTYHFHPPFPNPPFSGVPVHFLPTRVPGAVALGVHVVPGIALAVVHVAVAQAVGEANRILGALKVGKAPTADAVA
jgi:hypothetical protein